VGRNEARWRLTTRKGPAFYRKRKSLMSEVSRMISKAIERHELHSKLQKYVSKPEEMV
jgi:hypothetical protein